MCIIGVYEAIEKEGEQKNTLEKWWLKNFQN